MKQSKIAIPGVTDVQNSLYASAQPLNKYIIPFPEIGRTEKDFLDVLETHNPADGLGCDYEFDPKTYKPTVIGISSRSRIASLPASNRLTKLLYEAIVDRRSSIVGFSIAGAEKPIIDNIVETDTDLIYWDDGMLVHYLDNAVLNKTPGKEEGDEGSSLGFNNLWTAASLYLDVQNWKICRGRMCYGPCPYHRVFDYCGVDSWTGLEIKVRGLEHYISRGGNPEMYKGKYGRLRLAELCHQMQQAGIEVDLPRVRKLDELAEAKKLTLFTGEDFNPKSNIQIIDKAKSIGRQLAAADIKTIQKNLEKELKVLGYSTVADFEAIHGEGNENFEPELVAKKLDKWDTPNAAPLAFFYRLYKYKKTGKGGKSWFDPKYFGSDGLLHPRFNVTGTSLGRLSSSRPNATNVPRNGFGEEIRACFIAPSGYTFVKADYSQLELRVMLWASGVDPASAGPDAFTWLVEKSNGTFAQVAVQMNTGWDARDWAKTSSHASNYMEGIVFLDERDFEKPHTKKLIANGALRFFHDWKFRGKWVCFTGANMAERFLGAKTEENRKKMLELQWDVYFKNFPTIHQYHRKLLAEIENQDVFKFPSGRILDLYGPDLDDAKIAAAAVGQGTGADLVQEKMLVLMDEGIVPRIQVHDELDLYLPVEMEDKQVLDLLSLLVQESHQLPGLRSPVKVLRGHNWKEKEMKVLGKLQ